MTFEEFFDHPPARNLQAPDDRRNRFRQYAQTVPAGAATAADIDVVALPCRPKQIGRD